MPCELVLVFGPERTYEHVFVRLRATLRIIRNTQSNGMTRTATFDGIEEFCETMKQARAG